MQKLPINEIILFQRKRQLKNIEPLKESIKELGLLNPITVNKHKVLVSGYHRLQACKELGWQEIPVTIMNFDNLEAELAQIDENIVRNQLTVLENAEQLKRRKDIYEILHPGSTRTEKTTGNLKQYNDNPTGADIMSPSVKCFSKETSDSTGVTERTIRRYLEIGTKLSKDIIELLKGTPVEDNLTDLLALSKIESIEKQKSLIQMVTEGQAKNIRAAIKIENPPAPRDINTDKDTVPTKAYLKVLKELYDLKVQYARLEEQNANLLEELQKLTTKDQNLPNKGIIENQNSM